MVESEERSRFRSPLAWSIPKFTSVVDSEVHERSRFRSPRAQPSPKSTSVVVSEVHERSRFRSPRASQVSPRAQASEVHECSRFRSLRARALLTPKSKGESSEQQAKRRSRKQQQRSATSFKHKQKSNLGLQPIDALGSRSGIEPEVEMEDATSSGGVKNYHRQGKNMHTPR